MTTDIPAASIQELAKRASEIAKNTHLVAINVRRLAAELKAEGVGFEDEVRLCSQHSVEHRFVPGDEPRLTVLAHFHVKVKATDSEHDLFELNATFVLDYLLNRGIPEEAVKNFDAFARTNSMVHVWPYYRELVQSTTWRMGLPPLPLPLFRVGEKQEEKPAEGNEPG
jgi:hypothetical protein